MSRRKQAKPRAFLKLGEEASDCVAATEATNPTLELLDPKEELFSDADGESLDECEEDECQQQQLPPPTSGDIVAQVKQPSAQQQDLQCGNHMDTHAASGKSIVLKDTTNSVTNSKVKPVTKEIDLIKNSNKVPNASGKASLITVEGKLAAPELGEFNEELEYIEDDYDEDEYEDDEDIHSLDSYYSDMYSTHTSSSYSPSISDGTITPNSLLHHPHQPHLPPHHMSALLHPEEDMTQSQRLRRLHANNSTVNGGGGGEGGGGIEGADCDKNPNDKDKVSGDAEQLKRQARHAMKMSTKLRKIDREAALGGNKFDKSTGEGIKSGSNADGSYQCQFCDKSFPRLGYLKKHEQSHAEHLPFKCDYCARLFKHKRSRDRHTKLHTGDRRYRCPHCEAAFSRSDHLKIHMKTHDNQKPFQCTICNRGYNTAAALTSHMQNHKKQAAILAAGGNPQALNYSPRSTGSAASSNGSLHKRRYAMTLAAADGSPSRLVSPKRLRGAATAFVSCSYCTKADFSSLEQLNAHVQAMHEKELVLAPTTVAQQSIEAAGNAFQLACEYCSLKFPNIPAMFQHMRTSHLDRLASPNSYFEHFNRLAAAGTFSPRLVAKSLQRAAAPLEEAAIKLEQGVGGTPPPKQEEEPTDLSQNKRRSQTPATPTTPNAPASNCTPPGGAEQAPGVFFCNQCNAGLPDFEAFRQHLKSHLAQGAAQALQLVCHHCGLALREQSAYEQHVISHFLISSAEYNCSASGCHKTYTKLEELQQHLQEQHVVLMYKCALCAELYESKVALQVHFACAHCPETRLLRCTACMEVFHAEADFNAHVKARHQSQQQHGMNGHAPGSGNGSANTLQCMFCRTVCGSELEMHFHLAAHARQFRCPSCPETFHVEFLLDRHMQNQHGGIERPPKETYEEHSAVVSAAATPVTTLSPMNSLYVSALFGGKAPPLLTTPLAAPAQNNNNSMLDYNVAFAAHLNKGLFPAATGKFYSPLQVDTNAAAAAATMKHPPPHPALMYGLSQRYFDTNRTLIDLYAQHQQDKAAVAAAAAAANYFISPKQPSGPQQAPNEAHSRAASAESQPAPAVSSGGTSAPLAAGYSCDICARNDFRTEAEVHAHRKSAHNMRTGVSLRCAYCAGNFKSRSELEHHMRTCHSSTGKHKCLICDEIFPSPAILAEHKLQHSKVGQSGKCSHCAQPLGDVAAFKTHLAQHNNEAQMPVQCICCRQTLHSEFEIGLHAKFHTKSTNTPESVCALCLLEPVPNSSGEAKVCEKCCRKHNLRDKYKSREHFPPPLSSGNAEGRSSYLENRCNICKMVLPHASKLQEHLVEHTFAGCEERGYTCYICSAVFTAPSGLLQHMLEHGLNARPYDCNLCTEKYYFRAELDHHLVEHELRDKSAARELMPAATKTNTSSKEVERKKLLPKAEVAIAATIKQELFEVDNKSNAGDEDEYIEVEKVPEQASHAPAATTPPRERAEDARDKRLAEQERQEGEKSPHPAQLEA